jgi:integrase
MRKQQRQRKDYGLEQDARGIWHCDFSVAGRRFQRSTYTQVRKEAEEWCADLANRAWREVKLGEKPALTWEDAVALWFKDKEADGKRDLANDEDKKVVLEPKLNGTLCHELHTSPESKEGVNLVDLLDDLQDERGIANSTRNRYVAFIGGVLNHARKRGYNIPAVAIPKRKERRKERRALTKPEAKLLLEKLPDHLERPAHYSLACGARQGNVTGLRWFKARFSTSGRMVPHVTDDMRTMIVPPSSFKSDKWLHIPLNDEAVAVLIAARDCKDHGHKSFVFTYYGAPIGNPGNTAWDRACREADIQGFTWHELRHTWTTWMLEAGTPLEVVKDLGGWSSIHILLKHYAHLCRPHLAKYAGNSSIAPLAPADGKVVQLRSQA